MMSSPRRLLSALARQSSRICTARGYKTGSSLPDFTKDRYPIDRGNYATLSSSDVSFFEKTIGRKYVLTDSDDILGHNIDFLKSVRGNSQVVLKPGSAEEISAILKYCNEKKLAVCPQGGNTGLVGGSVPVFDEIVLSLNRLNRIVSIDEMTGIAVCESGVILEHLDQSARENGLIVPLDLGAKASCHIGGNVSTNAGGLRVLRYGNLHGSVLGVEAVLASGQILNLMSDFKKDNTGYHMKHLFIGSEGTLGVVTKLSILCPPAPKSVHVAFLGLQSFEAVLQTFLNAKRELGEILSSCEMLDEESFKASTSYFNLNSPVQGYPFYMLIETSGRHAGHDEEKFNGFLENGMNAGHICDGTVTSDPGKIQEIWKIRELTPVALIEDGFCFKYDISVPLRQFYDIVGVLRDRTGPLATRVCGYGHLGDSNLHLNICCEEFTQEIYKRVEPFVYEYTSQLRGSVSAEHGIGFLKTKYLPFTKSQGAIGVMKDMKRMFDPNAILNPYKVLRD